MARLIIGAVALSVVLAGCGGDPKADPAPSPTGVETTTPVSTTPTPPAMPAAAKANTKAGAIAFVRHYVDLVNYAQQTGNIDALAEVEEDKCDSCEKGRTYLSKIYQAGGHISGGSWTVRGSKARRSGGNWSVTVTGSFEPSDVYVTPSAKPSHANGGPTLTNFVVRYSDTWKVRTWFSG